MSDGPSPLEQLAEASNCEFPNLFAARRQTAEGLEARRKQIAEVEHDPDSAVVLVGSWGRAEVTGGSDDDFIVLVDGPERDEVRPQPEELREIFRDGPAAEGALGQVVFGDKPVEQIGLDADSNHNLTHRMLLLLESVPVSGDDVYSAVRVKILNRYLDGSVKAFRPPRFLLNEMVRYWRTMCVDFAAKEYAGPDKWGLRNAKLRTSRKMLFASGLLPILEGVCLDREEIPEFLRAEFATLPADRVARSFLKWGAVDSGVRTLGAYDTFLGRLNEDDFREELRGVNRDTAADSDAFREACDLAKELEAGLLSLLFETERLRQVVRETIVF
jgi:hypothetical protein